MLSALGDCDAHRGRNSGLDLTLMQSRAGLLWLARLCKAGNRHEMPARSPLRTDVSFVDFGRRRPMFPSEMKQASFTQQNDVINQETSS